MEDSNEELLKTNKLLEDKLEKLILRLEIMEEKTATRNSSVDDKAYVNTIPSKQLKLVSSMKGNTSIKFDGKT